MENIRVNVPSVFTVAIGTTPEQMQNAAIRLLGLSNKEIQKQAEDMIFGQLRQVIASMQIEDINRDRDKFLEAVQNSLEPELRKIGLVLINVNITDITDESGYIEAIGQKAASQADPEGPRRRGRQRADGRGPRGRGRAREVRQRGQRPQGPRDRHPRRHARAGGPRGRVGEGAEDRRADGRLPARRRGEGRRARHAHQAGPGRRPGGRGREPGQGRHRRLAGRACK